MPVLGGRSIVDQVRRQIVEPDPRFLLLGSVAANTMRPQNRQHISLEVGQDTFGVRTEINMFVGSEVATVTGPVQTEITPLLDS